MKHLIKYRLFETIQQAEKMLDEIEHNIGKDNWNYIKNEIIKNGLQNYLGWCAKNISDVYYIYDDFINVLKWIKANKIDYVNSKFSDIAENFRDYEKNIPYKKFINKWCPSSIKKDINIEEFRKKLSESFLARSSSSNYINDISDIRANILKMGSRCKNPDEWIDFISKTLNNKDVDIEFLKKSNVDIIAEDSNFIIFKPNDYISYIENIITTSWCLISKSMWENYKNRGYYFYIAYNKIDKEESMVFTIKENKIDTVHDYTNKSTLNHISNGYRSIDKSIDSKNVLQIATNIYSDRNYYK